MSPPDDPPPTLPDAQSTARAAGRDDDRSDPPDGAEAWRSRAVSLGYAAYFPAVFVATVVAPLLVARVTAFSMLAAFRYAMLAAAVAYVGGLVALCR
jgi:hypothetical protein